MVTERFLNLPHIDPAEATVESQRDAAPESVIDVRNLDAFMAKSAPSRTSRCPCIAGV